MAREMAAHLGLLEEDYRARGLPPEEAKLAAHKAYGGIEQAKELHREARSFLTVEHIAKDVRYGARNLLRTPGFTSLAILTIALGIGANTAIFSVVNGVLLQPLAYKGADRLVTVLHNGTAPVATANYIDWRDQSHSFEAMGGADAWSPNLASPDPSDPRGAEHLYALKVTQNLLPMLGVEPLLGRLFTRGEDQPGADHEAILSYALWQRRFGGNRDVLGKAIKLNGEAYVVVGVMPRGFQFAPFWAIHTEIWVPNAFGQDIYNRGGNHLRVFARLKPGVTPAQAQADMATVTARLERQYPATNRNVRVTPLKENVVGKVETPLLMMMGAVGFVLLIACANVAHMLLARTADRQKEVAVRVALGAGRKRIVCQLLTENFLLAGTGALAGLLFAAAGTQAFLKLKPDYIPRVDGVAIDARAVIFTLCVTVVTALVFGLMPALRAASGKLSDALKEGGRGDSDGAGKSRLRSFLVVSEFALAFVLLIGAGLTIRSFYALQSIDPGFNPQHVLSSVVSVAGTQEESGARRENFYRDLLSKLRTMPGVKAAGAINHLPLAGDLWDRSFQIEGRPKPRPGEWPGAVYRIVMPGYFETMQISLRRGRTITDRDDTRSAKVVLINERAADEYWPGEPPIGKRIALAAEDGAAPDWLTVIGVVRNAKQEDWAANPYPEMYLAALQTPEFLGLGTGGIGTHMNYITLVVRGEGDPAKLTSAMRQTIWSIDRNLTISQVTTMTEAIHDATAQPRFEMLLLGLFGTVALILAAIGIYGVMNYSVSRRTREIGIRLSLGASRADVLRMVIRQGMIQALAGTIAGLAGAIFLTKLMGKMLYGVKPTDAATFVGVSLLLIAAAVLAASIPAQRAAKIEPVRALRAE